MPFISLPAELRARILEFVLEPGPVDSKSVLGFSNPRREIGPPNVYLTLPLKTLIALYNSNPAGNGRGRFVPRSPLRQVCKQWKMDTDHVWGETMVAVGTWLSFLENRPPELLIKAAKIRFSHWSDDMYWADLARRHRLFARAYSILAVWRADLATFQAVTRHRLSRKTTYEFFVASSPQLSYTVHGGLPTEKSDEVFGRIERRVAHAFSTFDESQGEQPRRMVMSDTDNVDWDALRDDREIPKVT